MAIGQLLSDASQLGKITEARVTADAVMRGYEIWENHPERIEDIEDTLDDLQKIFGHYARMFPEMANELINNTIAYTLATSPKKNISSKTLQENANTVTVGLINNGRGVTMLAPEPGLTQDGYKEFLAEVSPDYIGDGYKWSAREIVDRLRNQTFTLEPTPISRNRFVINTGNGNYVLDSTGQPKVITFDSSDEHKEFMPRETSFIETLTTPVILGPSGP